MTVASRVCEAGGVAVVATGAGSVGVGAGLAGVDAGTGVGGDNACVLGV